MPKVDAVAVLAERIVRTLEEQRGRGPGAYPLTLAQLPALIDPETTPQQVGKALGKKPFAARFAVASRKSPDSPLALVEDAPALADSPLLLRFALNGLCTAAAPLQPFKKVEARVDKQLRPAFAAALQRRLAAQSWPAGIGVRVKRGQPFLFLEDYPPPLTPAAALSQTLLRSLEEQRTAEPMVFPSLSSLLPASKPAVTAALRKEALATPPFHGGALVAAPGDLAAPLALAHEEDALLGSDALLVYLVERTTTDREPLATAAALAECLAAELQGPFRERLRQRLAAGVLPDAVRISGDQVYASERAPLVLPARLLAALTARTDDSVTLRALAVSVEPTATPEQVQAALKAKALKGKLAIAFPDDVDAPVALAEHAERLTGSPALVEAALARVRTADSQAVPIAELAKAVEKKLRPSFAASVVARVEGGTLPATVGCLRVRKVPHLFLWADTAVSPPVRPTPEMLPAGAVSVPPRVAAAPLGPDFGQLFDEAFTRLDRGRGGHNLVSLVSLRPGS